MRFVLLIALSLVVPACSNAGAECGEACDRVLDCEDLDKTYMLDCSPFGSGCFGNTLVCADCINTHTCESLVAGACDSACTPSSN